MEPRGMLAAVVMGMLSACPAKPVEEPLDSGAVEEACNGIDDDQDGTVDLLPDGGPLTRPCALQQGVCHGSVSRCMGAAWAACEYVAKYQAVETRCDGLDNDCDGQVDALADVTLLDVTPDSGELDFGIAYANDYDLVVLDGGVAMTLPTRLVLFDSVLHTVGSVEVPPTLGLPAYMPTEAGWSRVYLAQDGGTCAVLEHLPASDGGVLVAEEVASACWSGTDTTWFRAVFRRDAVDLVALGRDIGTKPVMAWASLRYDGGSAAQAPDVTSLGITPHPGTAVDPPHVQAVDSRFLVTFTFWASPGTEALWVEPETGLISPRVDFVGAHYGVARLEPLVWFRPGAVAAKDAWVALDGGVLHGPEAGRPVFPSWRGRSDLGLLFERDADGGMYTVLASTEGPVTTRLASLPSQAIRIFPLDAERVLATWPQIGCTGAPYHCPTGRIQARPICLPWSK